MRASVSTRAFKLAMAFLSRKLRQVSKGVYIKDCDLDLIRTSIKAGKRVVLMPEFRSLADLPVLLYALFVNKVEVPFTVGSATDMPRASIARYFWKRMGYMAALDLEKSP